VKGYSETDVFSAAEQALRSNAERLVAVCPARLFNDVVRCHELARAVAQVMGLPTAQVCDGWYGMVNHSWIWTTPRVEFSAPPNVLDVYTPGRLPQVQLAHSTAALPFEYRRGDRRKDIRRRVVNHLVGLMMLAAPAMSTPRFHARTTSRNLRRVK
jgi:hypothetical protein